MGILDNINKLVGPAKAIAASRGRTSPVQAKMQFPTAERIVYGMYFKFNKVKYELDAKAGGAKFTNLTSGAHIFLPLPVSGLIENMGMSYNQQELGGVTPALINAGSNAAAAIRDNVTGDVAPGQNAQTVSDMFTSVTGAAAVTLRKVASEVVPGAGAIIDIKSGNVVNPYTVALFQSVQARAHNLTFRLIPRNKSDSDAIRAIVRQFQFHSLPGKSESGLFLTMPDEVEMAFYGTDKLFKFAPCVITNVSVNYSPFGTNSFFGEDGSPTGVEFTLSFQEIESLTRESYEQDGVQDAFGVGGASRPPATPPGG